jgi:hypothetical protein
MSKMHCAALAAALVCAGTLSYAESAQTITPEPIRLPASEFPLESSQLAQMIAVDDRAAMRRHAWTLWAGVTADSTQSHNGRVLPIWETWLSDREAFAGAARTSVAGRSQSLRSPLAIPRQFAHEARTTRTPRLVQAANGQDRLLAVIKLNTLSADFIAAPHSFPGGAGPTLQYNLKSDLDRLRAYFRQHDTPTAERSIEPFPIGATNLKLLFRTVKASGLTAIPLWAGPERSTDPKAPGPSTWTSCVAVDPSGLQRGTAKVSCNGRSVEADIVPISAFYHVRLSAGEARLVNDRLLLRRQDLASAGDYHVLVAMHITAKESPHWTWQTFWWQNGRNAPNNFPGGVDDMPDESRIKGAWRNYAMCLSNAIAVPFDDPKGKGVVCFNPWLEAQQTGGLSSNCMACHARATYPGGAYPPSYSPNGWVDSASPIFANRIKTDYVWAIQSGAR